MSGDFEGDPAAGPVIRDRRRIDPTTGQVREPAPARVPPAAEPPGPSAATPAPDGDAGTGDAGTGDAAGALQQLAERTADLQRVQAEYANYRRRVDRDREAVREVALLNVLTNLVPVLDDVDRARTHGELDGGFKAVGEALEAVVGKLGLQRYGEPGEPFDPAVHEALTHTYSDEVEAATAVAVLQPGYRIGTRVVRPALVAVAEPGSAEEIPPVGE